MDTIASRLAFAMASKKLKTSALVAPSGMTYQGIKKILDGKTASIKYDNLVALCRFLKINPDWLAAGDGEMEPQAAIDVQSRWVGDVQALQGPVSPSSGVDTESVYIPHYDTGGAMGHGLVLRDQPGVIRGWTVNAEWLQKNARNHTSAKNLVIVTGFGDSMRPIFQPGDPLLVDTGVVSVDFDGIYFFRVGDEGFVKRLQRIPGEGLVAISENKAYRDWTIKPDMDMQVFGRVIKAWCGEDY